MGKKKNKAGNRAMVNRHLGGHYQMNSGYGPV